MRLVASPVSRRSRGLGRRVPDPRRGPGLRRDAMMRLGRGSGRGPRGALRRSQSFLATQAPPTARPSGPKARRASAGASGADQQAGAAIVASRQLAAEGRSDNLADHLQLLEIGSRQERGSGRIWFRSIQEQLGRRLGDRVAVEAVGAVEVGQAAGLAEAVDAERRDPLAEHAAEPGQRGRRGVARVTRPAPGASAREQVARRGSARACPPSAPPAPRSSRGGAGRAR